MSARPPKRAQPPNRERDAFLADWYRLLRKYEGSSDPAIAYALKLHGPILDEVSDYAARNPVQPDLAIVPNHKPQNSPA